MRNIMKRFALKLLTELIMKIDWIGLIEWIKILWTN